MIRRIVLENYMSHGRTVIEPAEGLTVLTGPNNCGKSAVVDALETLCRNAAGDYMVRHGERTARVTVETDRHEFTWERTRGQVRYTIDGREVDRLGRGVPEDLDRKLRLPRVRAGDEDVEIHFAFQRAPVFLLDASDNKKATFFASSSDASYLLDMQRRHQQRVKSRKAARRRLRREVDALEGEIAALDSVDELAPRVAALERHAASVAECDAEAARLARHVDALDRARAAVARATAVCAASAALQAPPTLEETAPVERIARELAAVASGRERAAVVGAALARVDAPPRLDDGRELGAMLASLEHEARLVADARGRRAAIDREGAAVDDALDAWARDNPDCPTCGSPVDAPRLFDTIAGFDRGDVDDA